MPLLFKNLCDLLSTLESYSSRRSPLLPAKREKLYSETITQWFRYHKISLDSPDIDPVVLLSALLPARRTDRVYGIQAQSLSRKLRRCLNLGEGRWQQLEQWKSPGQGDLGECVERVQRQAEFSVPPPANEVTLEEVDRMLANIAKTNRFSAPSVRAYTPTSSPTDLAESLRQLYHRLQSREAKWLTRMILKDYPGLELKDSMLFRCIDARLPAMIRNQDSFESAIDSLRNRKSLASADPHGDRRPTDTQNAGILMPKLGTKVGRANYLKGRSVQQVISMVTGRLMSIERKYDGEYCQIHIDLSKRESPIQIFSKSGKDSTKDREKLHQSITKSLRIGSDDCGFTKACILEGEMVVWSDTGNNILPFCKLRKHVSRSGSFLGAAADSQLDPSEHLMMIYYDVLLIDDDPILQKPYHFRRKALERLVKRIKGRARLTTQREIRFASNEAPTQLRYTLALAFARQWEGIVLKPLNDPYFRCSSKVSHEFGSCWIKMKKDYIPGLGDTADFAVLGAGYSVKEAAAKRIPNLKWTHFYIGCLRNKRDVLQLNAKPRFTIIDRVNQCMTPDELTSVNRQGQFRALDIAFAEARDAFELDFQPGMSEMSVVFKEPFVFELLGSGFDRLPNSKLNTLRFPRVLKVHWDRDWKDAVGLDELQQLAAEARTAPAEDDSKEIQLWMDRLDQADRGAKGAMLPWDNSQEHKLSPQYRSTHSPNSNRRTQSADSIPMIRIDTAEMASWGQRLGNGEVMGGSNTPHSSNRSMSEGALSAAPNSSSPCQSQTPGLIPEMVSVRSSPQGNLKRTAIPDEADSLRALKKVKVQGDGGAFDEELGMPSVKDQMMKPQPLSTITNSACPRETPRNQSSPASPCSKSSAANETATGLHDRTDRNLQRLQEPSSSSHQENMSPTITQQTVQPTQHVPQQNVNTQIAPLSHPKLNLPTTLPPTPPPSSLPAPLPPHEPQSTPPHIPLPNPPTPIPTICIPDLTTHPIILLTPCVLQLPYSLVTTMLQPPSTTTLQPSNNNNIFWLPSSDHLLGPLLTPTHSHNKSLLVLVDESHEESMRETMKILIAFMPVWKPAGIAIWDWRVLRNEVGTDEEEEEMEAKRGYFLGNMLWIDEGGKEGEGKGNEKGKGKGKENGKEDEMEMEMEIRWRDGNVTRIPPAVATRKEI